jgi:hypothetical protein
MYYSLLIVLLGIVIAVELTIRDFYLGGVEISGWVLYFSLFAAASVQLWVLDRRPGYATLARSYAIGTFATILSDFVRTFGGVVNTSPQIIGAAGVTDVVFLAGPYLAVFYMIATLIFVIWLVIRERRSRGETM